MQGGRPFTFGQPYLSFILKSHEIFTALNPETLAEMLTWFRDNERDIYKSAVATLAANRKLRPVFVQKKPLKDQYAWIQKTLQLRESDSVGEQIMQSYLMSAQKKMLAMFCDGLGIEHDGEGSVNGALPKELDEAKLDETVDKLSDVFDSRIFTLYLHCFNIQVAGGYPKLTEKLESDERLRLS